MHLCASVRCVPYRVKAGVLTYVIVCVLKPPRPSASQLRYKLFYSIIKNPTDPRGTPIEKPITLPLPHTKPLSYFVSIPSNCPHQRAVSTGEFYRAV